MCSTNQKAHNLTPYACRTTPPALCATSPCTGEAFEDGTFRYDDSKKRGQNRSSDLFFCRIHTSISSVPPTMATPLVRLMPSWKKISARRMVRMVLDLSMGTTLFTSPSWRALK